LLRALCSTVALQVDSFDTTVVTEPIPAVD
jgi:hypothetical protein